MPELSSILNINSMKRVIVSMNVTLDGYMSGPRGELDWHFPYWTAEMSGFACAQLRTMDTIILGRKTYDPMADYWPGAPHNDFSCMMNSYKKFVFSTTLQNPAWINTSVIQGNILAEVNGLKQSGGKNIIIYGSSSIVSALMHSQLIDEFRLWVHPVVTGEGRLLFKALTGGLVMKLTRTKLSARV